MSSETPRSNMKSKEEGKRNREREKTKTSKRDRRELGAEGKPGEDTSLAGRSRIKGHGREGNKRMWKRKDRERKPNCKVCKDCNFVTRRGEIERENRKATREGVSRKVNIMKVGLDSIGFFSFLLYLL